MGQGDCRGQHQAAVTAIPIRYSITFRSANSQPAGARDISIAVIAAPLAAIAHDRRKVPLADDLKSASVSSVLRVTLALPINETGKSRWQT